MSLSNYNISLWFNEPAAKELYKPVYDQADTLVHESLPFAFLTDSTQTVQVVQPPRPDFGDMRVTSQSDWITIILLISVAVFTFARYNFSRRMGLLLKACLLPRAVTQLSREGNPFNEQVSLALGVVYLLTSSLFVYIVLDHFNWLPVGLVKNEWIYVAILAVNFFYWLMKSVANKMLAHIFKTHDATGSYLLNNLLFNLTLGLIFLLLLPLMVYTQSEILLKCGLFITGALLIYKVYRGIIVGLSVTRFPLFYLLLYILALEVAPLLLIAKFFL